MTCSGRYATADQFVSFWCISGVLAGGHNGAGGLVLNDPSATFIEDGVEVGMLLYNTTTGLTGLVTAVSDTTITTAALVWANGNGYKISLITAAERAQIENWLDLVAADIHVALAASGACNCTFDTWVDAYLQKINTIEAGAFYHCPCLSSPLPEDTRQSYIDWATSQLDMIRTGKLDPCAGGTGSEFPAYGSIQQSLTDWSADQIVKDTAARLP
jgi:hypothetical protein